MKKKLTQSCAQRSLSQAERQSFSQANSRALGLIHVRLDRIQRREALDPNARRESEAERIVNEWDDGGYIQFVKLLERASQGAIATPERARALLPTLLEVIDEETQFDREVERAAERTKFGIQMRRERGEV